MTKHLERLKAEHKAVGYLSHTQLPPTHFDAAFQLYEAVKDLLEELDSTTITKESIKSKKEVKREFKREDYPELDEEEDFLCSPGAAVMVT